MLRHQTLLSVSHMPRHCVIPRIIDTMATPVKVKEAKSKRKPQTLEEMVHVFKIKKACEAAKSIASSLNVCETHLHTMHNQRFRFYYGKVGKW